MDSVGDEMDDLIELMNALMVLPVIFPVVRSLVSKFLTEAFALDGGMVGAFSRLHGLRSGGGIGLCTSGRSRPRYLPISVP